MSTETDTDDIRAPFEELRTADDPEVAQLADGILQSLDTEDST
mgnify:CR=1 FL=1